MSVSRAFGCLTVAMVFCATVCSAQTVYKWVDKAGVVHFDSVPPEDGSTASVMRLKAERVETVDVRNTGGDENSSEPSMGSDDGVSERMKAYDALLCGQARDSLRTLKSESVTIRLDKRSGERRVLSAEEAVAEIERAQADVERFCADQERAQ